MKKNFAALLLSALVCSVPEVSRATHYAVCTGVNQYKSSYVPSSNWLDGCVPDANHVWTHLTERGEWTSATTTKLLNSAATKTAVRKAITDAAAAAVSGDVFVYYHSSHGGNDYGNYDVYLCTYNADYTDAELASDLAQFKSGVKVVVMVDACHSGGLFKSVNGTRALAKASPGDFDLAGRVSAAIDAIRADETARGIKASARIASSEIGWVTAADYDQYSWDGSDGGAFTEAALYGWDSGICDNRTYGNQDGYANFYELWNYAKDIATGQAASGEDHTDAQCHNESVLRATIAGWVGDEEPAGVRFAPIPEQTATVGVPLSYTLVATNATGIAGSIAYSVVSATAPANTYSLSGSAFTFTPTADGAFSFTFLATNATAGASSRATMTVTASLAAPTGLSSTGVTTTSFTANWNAVSGANSYELDVASTPFGSRAAGDNVLLEEDFAGFTGTAADRSSSLDDYLTGTGWTGSKVFENSGSAKLGSGSYSGWIATPELDLSAGGTVSFDLTQYGTSGDGNTVVVSIVSGGDETSIGTLTPGATETVELTIPAASAATSVKIATSAKRAIIDNLVISGGSSADILAGQSVSGTSYTVTDLITGTYYWRVRAVRNAKSPYSETEEVTLVADPSAPPAIRPIDDIAVTMGETVTLAIHASAPEAAPVTSLAITSGDSAATLNDGVFSFTPNALGSYSFTITAVNANGFAEESFTVTVTLAEPTAPEASSVSHNAFTASWTAVPGATSYDLIVFEGAGSGDSGDSGDSGNTNGPFVLVDTADGLVAGEYVILAENADRAMNNTCSGASSGYLSYEEVTVAGSSISTNDASIIWTLAGNASSCTLFNAEAGMYVNPATTKTVGWASSPSGSWTLSLNGGIVTARNAANTSWTLQYNSSSPRFACYESSQKKLRFFRRGTRSLPRAVGAVVVSNNVGAVTSYAVTGLQPETDYTFAIRALASGAATEWTAFSSVTTTVAPAAPAWSEIPAMTASVGHPFRVDLAPYVSGVPTPTLTLTSGSGTLTGTFLEFTPAAAGSTTFTVSAANGVGDAASATFAVTAVVHEPVQYAVCVGINEYVEISSLAGCVNDAQVMASNLVERGGWAPANVTLLTDAQATKAAIRAAITNAAANALAGDTFVYQHSSHGGQFNATENDEEPLTGEDGKATFLCVYEEEYYDNTTAYNDYEIAADLAAFPAGVKVVVIVDACHSGGLFKSKVAAKASAASFDLAGRVTALMDADRARRRARGEDVARTLSSSEIGWATAAEYYEYSYDGGFYHTDEWLTNATYGDEYYDEYTQDYDYPASYRLGGVFLASATWSWWDGDGDADVEAGDNDGLCDAYEFWKKGYDFCSVIGEYWYDESDYNYYPQCANTNVLKSVELGWGVDPRPAAPTNAVASGVTSSSFTATWSAVSNAVSYLLHVQKKVADGSRAADSVTLLSESFETGEIPSDWTASSSGVGIASGKGGDGTYCVKFTASGATLITPALENPDSVSFQYKRSSNTADWFLDVFVGSSATGPWTLLDTVNDAGTAWQTFSSPISASGTAYLKFADARSSGAAERYIDLVVVTGSTGTWEDLAGYAPKSVVGTSQEVTGLDASTDYRFSVRSVDANGLEGVNSERTVVHTADADSAPVWSTLPALSGTVGGEDIEFTLESSTADVADYAFDDGYLLFTPSEAGTFTFTFLASNTIGTATATLTTTIAAAPVYVPTLTISDVSNSGALASWTACDGVASYTLQVATDDQFTEDSAGGTFELFNNPATSTSAPTDWTYDIKNASGSYLQLMADNEVVTEAFDASASTDLSLSLYIRTYGGATYPSVTVQYSTDNGSTWSDSLGTLTAANSTMAQRTLDVSAAAGSSSVRLRIASTSTSASIGVGIKSIVLTGTGNPVAGSIILSESVTDTFYAIGNLSQNTTYYARVKGDSDWSEVEEFTTGGTGTADYAPIWVGLPTPSILVGADCELNIGNYVYAQPDPVLALTTNPAPNDAIFDDTDGSFLFSPTAAGEYAFVFEASNTLGTATATLTVTVAPAPPAALSAPVLLPASDITTNSFTINWSAVDNADGYLLDVVAGDSTGLPARAARDAAGTWTLVTDDSTLAIGDQIIIAAATNNCALGAFQNNNNRPQVAIVKSGSTLETPDATVAVLTLGTGTVANAWSFYDANSNGYLYAASSSANHLKTKAGLDANGSWSIAIDSTTSEAALIAQGNFTHNILRYNGASSLFSCYEPNKQGSVCLYRLEGGSSGGSSLPNNLAVTGTSYELTGLDPATTYTYQLRATSSVYGLTSPVSAPGSATTLGEVVPVTVPTLTVTNVTATTADASWTACDGVSTYTLQLATNGFPVASSVSRSATPILSEDFSDFTGNGTADIGTNGTLDDHTATTGWTGSKVYTAGETAKIGASSGQGWIMTPALDASGTLTVAWSAYRYGTSDKNTLLLGVSENGTDFDEETITIGDEMTGYTNTFTVTGPTVYVRWKGAATSKARFYLDEVTITASTSGGDVPADNDIQEFTVSGTSYNFTGLTPETTYYARVKGDAGWSNVEEFTTESVGEFAPVWSANFPSAWTMTAGDIDGFDVTDYLSGDPTPVITLATDAPAGDVDFEDGGFIYMPTHTGTFTFTFTASNDVGTANTVLVATVSGAAPSWNASFPTTATVTAGEDYEFSNVSAYASGSPSPTVALTSADSEDCDYDNDVFSFITTTPGTYEFVFTASNVLGTATAPLTVTVNAAPVTVPTLTVTNVTATTANASWTACNGVSSYTLQLASDNQFTTGGSGAAVLEADFSDTTGWTLSGTGQYTGATYCGADTPSIKFDGNGDYAISPDFGSGVKLQFWAYGNGGSGSTFAISGLVNGSWIEIETVTIAQGGDTYEVTLPSGTSQVRFDFTKSVNCALDDVVVYGASGSGSLIAEYTVSGTSYDFTGLSPETTYYARVMGDAGWSNVEEFTTEAAAVSEAPVWSSLPAQTVNVSETLEFDLAPYVTGSPVPVILLGDTEFVADMQGSTFVFDPSSSGDYTFSFTASNEVGTADATLSVTAISEAPELTITPDTSFSVTVGDTVEFSVTATGIPTPDISVSSYDAVTYDFTNGEFSFTPSDPGTYTFEVSASNVVGTDTLTVTVEVLATVPTLTVSNVTATTAFASWNNCANVLEYTLQLSTNEYFEATGGAGIFTEDFTGFTATGYSATTESQTVTSGTWSYENVIFAPNGAADVTGTMGYAQLKANTGYLYLPVVDSPDFISIVARASMPSGGSLTLEQQVNGSWVTLETWTLVKQAAEYTSAFSGAGASTVLRLRAEGRPVYIYDLTVTGADSGSVSDGTGTFQVLEGSGTSSYTFTGLLPDTTYWARVKGDSDWSDPVSFHTLAGPANLAEAFGLPVGLTDEYIVCRITSFSVDDTTGAEGTFAVTAEDEGSLLAESQTMATNVRLVVLGAATLDGGFTALDETTYGVELTSRTAPFGFRVSQPGTNRFFQVRLVVDEVQ